MEVALVLRWLAAAGATSAALHHLHHLHHLRGTMSMPRRNADVDLAHAVMGLATAAMLVIGLGRATTTWLLAAFVCATAWFVVGAVATYIARGARAAGEQTRQSLCCLAMAGMLAVTLAGATTAAEPMPSAMHGVTTLVPALVALLAVQAVAVGWTAAGLHRRDGTVLPRHRVAQLVTGLGGVAMLATMF